MGKSGWAERGLYFFFEDGSFGKTRRLLTPLTKKQIKAVEKTHGGRVKKTSFPPRLQIPQKTRNSHFTTASAVTG